MVRKLFPDLHSWAADSAGAGLHRYPAGTKRPRSLAGDRAERRLQTTGQGTRRVTRMANRVTGGQSLRANGGQLMRSLKYARRHATATRYTLLRFRNAKMKRGSFGSSGG